MRLRRITQRSAASALVAFTACFAATSEAVESRGYVISWFATATHVGDFKSNCPKDKNGGQVKLNVRQLVDVGYSEADALKIVQNSGAQLLPEYTRKIFLSAKVNGQPVPIYNYPEATEDPNIETVVGKFAWGFDLGGKAENKFTDPETQQRIDNQLWRAVGCLDSFRSDPPGQPYPEELSWNLMIDSAPGWALRLVGEDLDRDGKVTVILDRLTQHLERAATGEVLRNATYVIEPDSRSHNEFVGEIKNGVLTIEPSHLFLEGEHPFYHEIELKNAHMRLKVAPEKITGYWGGLIDWRKYVYMYTSRPANGADSIGMYHALKRMADFDPDPATGQNRLISGTYRIEAIPAFLADGRTRKIVAAPAGSGMGQSLTSAQGLSTAR